MQSTGNEVKGQPGGSGVQEEEGWVGLSNWEAKCMLRLGDNARNGKAGRRVKFGENRRPRLHLHCSPSNNLMARLYNRLGTGLPLGPSALGYPPTS